MGLRTRLLISDSVAAASSIAFDGAIVGTYAFTTNACQGIRVKCTTISAINISPFYCKAIRVKKISQHKCAAVPQRCHPLLLVHA